MNTNLTSVIVTLVDKADATEYITLEVKKRCKFVSFCVPADNLSGEALKAGLDHAINALKLGIKKPVKKLNSSK
jgi:ribosomal silencing factor RsfS